MKILLLSLIILLNSLLIAQNSTEVSGKISDRKHRPMPAVSVQDAGFADVFTLSDSAGNFRITLPRPQAEIQFSYKNYVTQTHKIKFDTVLSISLLRKTYSRSGLGISTYVGGTNLHIDVSELLGYDSAVHVKMKPLALKFNIHQPIQNAWEQHYEFELGLHFLDYFDTATNLQKKGAIGRAVMTTTSNYHVSILPKLSGFVGFGAQLQYIAVLKNIAAGAHFNVGFAVPLREHALRFTVFSDITGGKVKDFGVATGQPFRLSVAGIGAEYMF